MSDPAVFDPHDLHRRDLVALRAYRAALADAAEERLLCCKAHGAAKVGWTPSTTSR